MNQIGMGSMRNFAIYQDKIILATTDARLVALDARNGKLVWTTVIADRTLGYSNTSGPIVARGKVIQGLQGCTPLRPRSLLHQRLRRRDRQARVEVQHHRARRRAGRRYVGQAHRQLPQGRRDLDRRQLRSRSEPHLLGHRAGEAVDAGEPRHHGLRRGALRGVDRRAERRRRQAGVALPACARRVARPRRGVRARARRRGGQKMLFTIGKAGILWKLDRTQRAVPRLQGNGLPERLRSDRSEDRRADLSRRHHRAAGRAVDPVVPEHRGRAQLAGDELPPADQRADHPAQPVVHGDVRPEDRVPRRRRRHRRRPALLRDAGLERQRRQARRVRRRVDEGAVELPAARGVPHGGAVDGRRRRVCRRSRSPLPRVRREDRADSLGHAARARRCRASRCRSP